MILQEDKPHLVELLKKQLCNFFHISIDEIKLITSSFDSVIKNVEYNFSNNTNKYYFKEIKKDDATIIKEAYFNPYHSAQYCIYLYLYSHIISEIDKILADKLYYLNKILNRCDLYHEVKLPNIFSLDHPVGTVMGRAQYGDFFSFAQNCTVGNNNGIYPIIGENVKMTANTMIIGNSHIGSNVTVGAGAIIKDQNVPDNVYVFGESPNLIIKPKKNV